MNRQEILQELKERGVNPNVSNSNESQDNSPQISREEILKELGKRGLKQKRPLSQNLNLSLKRHIRYPRRVPVCVEGNDLIQYQVSSIRINFSISYSGRVSTH